MWLTERKMGETESGEIWGAQKMEMESLKEKRGGGIGETWRICSVRDGHA